MNKAGLSRFAVLAVLPFGMAACGGATTGGSFGGNLAVSPPTEGCETAASCTYDATSTRLAGAGVLETRNKSLEVTDRSVSYASVDLDVPGNSLDYADSQVRASGPVVVGDIADPDSSIIAQDATGTVQGLVSVSPGPGYEFVKAVTGNNTDTNALTPYLLEGYVGLVTDASAVPVAGVATYAGDASGGLDTGGDLPEILLGSAALTANFGGGTADLTADFSMTTNGADLVKVTGMEIDGNTFSGGALEVYEYDAIPAELNLTGSDVLGGNVSHSATGVFFGVDETLALEGGGTTTGPDEVAGAVVATGDDAELYYTWVAD